MNSEAKKSLYDQIGGQDNIRSAVELFYKKILMDGRVSHFFDSTDMRKLYAHQSQFLGYALGGPEEYKGKDIREAHKDLVTNHGMTERHFDIVAEHLLNTLIDMGVDKDLRSDVMGVVGSTKDAVLNR